MNYKNNNTIHTIRINYTSFYEEYTAKEIRDIDALAYNLKGVMYKTTGQNICRFSMMNGNEVVINMSNVCSIEFIVNE